jgi:hypothetical protein
MVVVFMGSIFWGVFWGALWWRAETRGPDADGDRPLENSQAVWDLHRVVRNVVVEPARANAGKRWRNVRAERDHAAPRWLSNAGNARQ